MSAAEEEYPYYVRGVLRFDVPLSHRMMAAADILLMPSRFEPCGLNQVGEGGRGGRAGGGAAGKMAGGAYCPFPSALNHVGSTGSGGGGRKPVVL